MVYLDKFWYVEVWYSNQKQLIGRLIELDEYLYCLKLNYVLHSFSGRIATVCVISKDESITRGQKLDFAIAFMKGTYVTVTFDLRNLSTTRTDGKPPP